MARTRRSDRTRDPERTKTAILDAAELLFAKRGFDRTTLQDIGVAASVSRGTPGYFFGSKEELFHAVLDRSFAELRDALARAAFLAAEPEGGAEHGLTEGLGAYLDFLAKRPSLIRLMVWDALQGGTLLDRSREHASSIREARDMLQQDLDEWRLRDVDASQLLVSIVSLCWFPFAGAEPLLRVLDLDPRSKSFVDSRRRHLVQLLLHGLGQRDKAPTPERGAQ